MGDYEEVTADEDVDMDVTIAELELRRIGARSRKQGIADAYERARDKELMEVMA